MTRFWSARSASAVRSLCYAALALLAACGTGAPARPTTSPPTTAAATTARSATVAPPSAYRGLLLTKAEIDSLPISGNAWSRIKSDADALKPAAVTPEDQDNRGCGRTMGAGLAYLRTGTPSYAATVRDVLLAIATHNYDVPNATLALARNLQACVIAADLVNLPSFDPAAHATFSHWLAELRTKELPHAHGRWMSMRKTCWNSASNWGTSSCASLLAADWYLGDAAEIAFVWQVYQAWLGDRAVYPPAPWGAYFQTTAEYDPTFFCDPPNWTGVNPAGCTLANGFNADGSLGEETSRSAGPCCPPDGTGWMYELTSFRGALAAAELFHRLGYTIYPLQSDAIRRVMDFSIRNNQFPIGSPSNWLPWAVNFHYGTTYPTLATLSDPGYNLAYGDWLWSPSRVEQIPGPLK